MSAALDQGRLDRLRSSIEASGCDAGLFYDPTNIRYATGTDVEGFVAMPDWSVRAKGMWRLP